MAQPAMAEMKKPGILHSVIWLAGSVAAIALLMLPVAIGQSGSGSPWGLAAAAGICLGASLAAEAVACVLVGPSLALQRLAFGMGARMLPPLAVCCFIAMQGESGLNHLAFVCYLLVFYLVTLTVDTSLAVRRSAGQPAKLESSLS